MKRLLKSVALGLIAIPIIGCWMILHPLKVWEQAKKDWGERHE